MVDTTRDKCGAASRTESDKTRKKAPEEICEICGQEMERDPESGEFLCPYCYYSDEEE
jgi:predicted RNA-binding Zn-ribbon protein involved in translation (DUF1610 family)